MRTPPPQPTSTRVALITDPERASAVAAVAAATFPLACPPGTTADDTAAFIAEHLTVDHFRAHIHSPHHDLLAAISTRDDTSVVGYALVIHGPPTDPEVAAAVTERPASEVSKLYVTPDAHGSGLAQALMARAIHCSAQRQSRTLWLGVSNQNVRAQRFYAACGFVRIGRKSFWLNGVEQRDYVMSRAVPT